MTPVMVAQRSALADEVVASCSEPEHELEVLEVEEVVLVESSLLEHAPAIDQVTGADAARGLRVRSDRELLVGGPLPLAPGLIQGSVLDAAVSVLSSVLDGYWRTVRHLIG